MKQNRTVTRFVIAAVWGVAVMAKSLWAQGCPMCYQNAAAASSAGRTALRHGILVLLLPALSFLSGIFVLIYKRRNVWR